MRVTFNSQYRDAQASIDIASQRLVEMQRQVASGKRVNKPSDDPSAAASAVAERAQIGTIAQYQRAADSVVSRLTVVDTALSGIIERLTAAQVAATSARGSTAGPAQREAAALELEGIRAALVDGLNTTFRGTFVFAGALSTTPPYQLSPDGSVVEPYAGSTQEVDIDIGDQRSITVGFNGRTIAQGGAAADMFAQIDALVVAARAGDNAALGDGIDAMKEAFTRVTAAQSRVGIGLNAVEGEKIRLEEIRIAGGARLSKLEDANMVSAISEMNQAETAYRAALGAIGTANKMSLLDYLG
jgi:flagellar hook-associated protein 3 FlgL